MLIGARLASGRWTPNPHAYIHSPDQRDVGFPLGSDLVITTNTFVRAKVKSPMSGSGTAIVGNTGASELFRMIRYRDTFCVQVISGGSEIYIPNDGEVVNVAFGDYYIRNTDTQAENSRGKVNPSFQTSAWRIFYVSDTSQRLYSEQIFDGERLLFDLHAYEDSIGVGMYDLVSNRVIYAPANFQHGRD